MQSEMGDFDNITETERNTYSRACNFVPNQTEEMLEEIKTFHRSHK